MNGAMNHLPALERLPSGVAGLDRVLNGGFLKKRIYLIMGPAGSGKTILSNQICFHHVANGGHALYLTLLTETSSRMLADLQSFSFFSLPPVSDTLSYVSGYAALKQDGLDGFLNLLRIEVRRLHATLVIIDGAIIAAHVASSPLDWMQFLHSLQALTELLGCTTFLLTPVDEKHTSQGEQTLVEGVLELTTRSADMRSVRELQVHKFRGSSFLEGRHLYTINDSGLVVYPRTEAISAFSPTDLPSALASTAQTERFSVGIAQLDTMLHGGLPAGSTTLVLGAPGTGKTLLGSNFLLDGAAHTQKGLYYSFYETPAQLIRKLALFGLDLARFVTDGQVELVWQSPVQDHLDLLAEHILTAIQRSGAQRLFLDGLGGFRRSVASPERLDLFLTAFFTTLRRYGITTICSVELPDLFSPQLYLPASISGITALAENVILLRYVELHSQLYRLISIMKMRESDYDHSICEFHISSSQGIEIAPTFSSAEAILTSVARVRSDILNTGNSSAMHVDIDPSLGEQV